MHLQYKLNVYSIQMSCYKILIRHKVLFFGQPISNNPNMEQVWVTST